MRRSMFRNKPARRPRRWLRRGLITMGLVLLAAAAAVYWSLYASLLPTTGVFAVDGLQQPVSIRWDDFGRPFVHAHSFDDALFAEGWLHGGERLWQMELLRRAGSGRLAQAFGVDAVLADRELSTLGVPHAALALEQQATPALRAHVERYVAGINARRTALKTWPPEFQLAGFAPDPWNPADVYAVAAMTALQAAADFRDDLLRLALAQQLPAVLQGAFAIVGRSAPALAEAASDAPSPAVLTRLQAIDARRAPLLQQTGFAGSAWALAPSRTRGGRALLGFSAEGYLQLPSSFYEIHLFYGDQGEQVNGWSLPGLPGVIDGYNQRVAWALTAAGRSPELTFDARDANDRSLSVQWAKTINLDALLDANRARDAHGFRAAIARTNLPGLVATFADIDGNIGRCAAVGDSAAEADSIVNPAWGFVATADGVPEYRLRRLRELLAARADFLPADIPAIALDRRDNQADLLLGAMLPALPPGLTGRDGHAMDILKAWREHPDDDSQLAAPAIFQHWYLEIAEDIFAERLGAALYAQLLQRSNVLDIAMDRLLLEETDSPWWRGAREHILIKALQRAVEGVTQKLGPDPGHWSWDALQHVRFTHDYAHARPPLGVIFDRGPYPLDGGPSALARAGFSNERPFDVRYAAVLRAGIELSAPITAQSVLAGGQSGHPLSAHYGDQLPAWRQGRQLPAADLPDIAGATVQLLPRRP